MVLRGQLKHKIERWKCVRAPKRGFINYAEKFYQLEQLKMFQFGWGQKETEWGGREIIERIEFELSVKMHKLHNLAQFSLKLLPTSTKFLVAAHNFNISVFRLRPLVNQLSSSKDVFRARLKIIKFQNSEKEFEEKTHKTSGKGGSECFQQNSRSIRVRQPLAVSQWLTESIKWRKKK